MLQEHKGSLPECDIATEAVLEQQITLWWRTLALAEASVPLIATVREPLEHTLSLFSQQIGWRYNVPDKFQVKHVSARAKSIYIFEQLSLDSETYFNYPTVCFALDLAILCFYRVVFSVFLCCEQFNIARHQHCFAYTAIEQ